MRKRFIFFCSFLAAAVTAFASVQSAASTGQEEKGFAQPSARVIPVKNGPLAPAAVKVVPVKYVFLFIGDGMATPQRMVTDCYLKETTGKGLCMNTFPVQGYSTTMSADSLITDSAAAATAMATGFKTYGGAIGVNVNKEPVETVAEVAHKTGKKVGIITTTSINHATPAGFYAHQRNRGQYYEIAEYMYKSGFEFFAGGGVYDNEGHINVTEKGQWKWEKNPRKDMYEILIEKGFTIANTRAEFDSIGKSTKTPIYVKNPHLAEEDTCFYEMDRKPEDITLAMNVAKAIEVLEDNPQGFFIMTEGGKVDWTAHGNDAAGTVSEIIGLDAAVEVAYNFALKHPKDTLIVVTGDHETGALTLGFSGTGYSLFLKNIQAQKTTNYQASIDFSNMMKAAKEKNTVVSYEEAQRFVTEKFGLIYPDKEKNIVFKSGSMVLSDSEVARLKEAYERAVGIKKDFAPTENKHVLYSGYNPLVITAIHIVSNKSGIAWMSFHHSAMPVATSSIGVNSFLFGNISDNTDIGKNLRLVFSAKPESFWEQIGF